MSSHVTDLVGYDYSPAKKSWLAAFFIGEFDKAASKPTGHYELLPLDEIKKREQAALNAGDYRSAREYDVAETAIEDTLAGKRSSPRDLPPDFKSNLFAEHNGELFRTIDPVADVDWTEFRVARKTAKVRAEFVEAGTKVETVMANGLVETSKTAGEKGGYKITAQTGEQYLVDPDKFAKLYQTTSAEGVYEPRPDPRKVLDLKENVSFTASWGEDMRIRSGGVLVKDGPKKAYGIQGDEFHASYSFGQ